MKQKNNSIMRGISGALGKELIFRQRAGQTIVSLPPAPRADAPTEKQMAVRDRFRKAVRYARAVIADPTLKAIYQARAKPGSSAFNTAITEYLQTSAYLRNNTLPVYSSRLPVSTCIKYRPSGCFEILIPLDCNISRCTSRPLASFTMTVLPYSFLPDVNLTTIYRCVRACYWPSGFYRSRTQYKATSTG